MRNRFHSLKHAKIRQTWHKYNLYNLAQLKKPQYPDYFSLFKQKWKAKSISRGYHGEQVREKQWQRMFRSNMPSVVPMNHAYLAKSDGSEQAAGRGSGLHSTSAKERTISRTPYTSMVYAPIERRLDTSIFRALFASSTRQARQFVVHGAVKVNGKKMICPGYLLNPGDMFQVDPERVLFATGAPKDRVERRVGRKIARGLKQRRAAANPTEDAEEGSRAAEGEENQLDNATAAATEGAGNVATNDARPGRSALTPDQVLKRILARARSFLDDSSALPGKRRKDLREFQRTVKRALARPLSVTSSDTADFDASLNELLSKLSISPPSVTSTTTADPTSEGPASKLDPADQRALKLALREASENPVDATKPYATPWRPRDFMSAFAFIPRYLEVNQNICSAVYLRHPVARPGIAEVASPFHPDTHQLVHNWYLRRR